MFTTLFDSVKGFFKILILAALLGATSMLVSFLVVNHLARDVVEQRVIKPAVLREASTLRVFSNQLADLCNGYVRRIPEDPAKAPEHARLWVENVFRPEVQFLQQRMAETFFNDTSLTAGLEAAAARCATMGRYPTDGAIRAGALRESADTIARVESWIASEGVSTRLSVPAEPVRFP